MPRKTMVGLGSKIYLLYSFFGLLASPILERGGICYNIFVKNLKYLAIAGNVLFILWLAYNGIDEGFKASNYQFISYITLIALLLLNIYFLSRKK